MEEEKVALLGFEPRSQPPKGRMHRLPPIAKMELVHYTTGLSYYDVLDC